MIIGTAGHIDHGKTSLVRALTGVETDRLKEEKTRGISIELGYAYSALPNGDVLGFIDVPGHDRLIHTMVAGVGGIDFALLVVAADDGIMPQTHEHLAILQLLGVTAGAVALTKADCVNEQRVASVHRDIVALLATTTLREAPLFVVDARSATDSGIAALRAHLHAAASRHVARDSQGLFRMAVDRVFILPGRGTIVTGTVRSGRVQVGDTVQVLPSRTPVGVRTIHAQNRDSASGVAGQRCALNLTGIEKEALSRGDWVADGRALQPTLRVDVRLRWFSSRHERVSSLKSLHFHAGTTDAVVNLVLLSEAAAADGWYRAQCVFGTPVCVAAGDGFIVRDAQASNTLGGGRVLDPDAPARRRRSAERMAYLDAIAQHLDGGGIGPLLAAAPRGIPLADLERLCGLQAALLPLPADVRVIGIAGESIVFERAAWNALRANTLASLHRFHAQHPDEPGVERSRLRRMTMPALADGIWRELIRELIDVKAIVLNAHWLHLGAHRLQLGEVEQRLAEALDAAMEADRFEPKWVRDLAVRVGATEPAVRKVLLKRVTQAAAYQIVHDLFCNQPGVLRLRAALRTLASRDGTVQAAEYRDALGVGRKRAIQILEFFDRVGYTRRTRDARVLRADSHWHDA